MRLKQVKTVLWRSSSRFGVAHGISYYPSDCRRSILFWPVTSRTVKNAIKVKTRARYDWCLIVKIVINYCKLQIIHKISWKKDVDLEKICTKLVSTKFTLNEESFGRKEYSCVGQGFTLFSWSKYIWQFPVLKNQNKFPWSPFGNSWEHKPTKGSIS